MDNFFSGKRTVKVLHGLSVWCSMPVDKIECLSHLSSSVRFPDRAVPHVIERWTLLTAKVSPVSLTCTLYITHKSPMSMEQKCHSLGPNCEILQTLWKRQCNSGLIPNTEIQKGGKSEQFQNISEILDFLYTIPYIIQMFL
jgi:hypothetical protein